MFGKIFEREMLIITKPTTLLQIFCEHMLNSKGIFKSVIVPDDTLVNENFRHKWVTYVASFIHTCSAQNRLTFLVISLQQEEFSEKIFDGEMLIKIQFTTHFEIYC